MKKLGFDEKELDILANSIELYYQELSEVLRVSYDEYRSSVEKDLYFENDREKLKQAYLCNMERFQALKSIKEKLKNEK